MLLRWLNKRYKITQRVDNGIHFMDEINPNWRDYVKPHLLNMADVDWCVGALYMKYTSSYVFANYDDFKHGYGLFLKSPTQLGFEVSANNRIIGRLQYWLLTKEWRKRIQTNRKGQNV